jgi:hypothetical protein
MRVKGCNDRRHGQCTLEGRDIDETSIYACIVMRPYIAFQYMIMTGYMFA